MRLAARLAVFAVCLLSFANGLGNELTYDDKPFIAQNPSVLAPGNWLRFFAETQPPQLTQGGIYRPLAGLSFALNYRCGGSRSYELSEMGLPRQVRPWIFRLTNLILHILVSLAVFELARRWLLSRPRGAEREASLAPDLSPGASAGRDSNTDTSSTPAFWGALTAALLFAAHPIHVEAVTSIVGRGEVMACLFYLAAIACFLTAAESSAGTAGIPAGKSNQSNAAAGTAGIPAGESKQSEAALPHTATPRLKFHHHLYRHLRLYLQNPWFLAACACYLLALWSKEMALTLPALLAWLMLCRAPREEGGGLWRSTARAIRRLAPPLIPFVLIFGLYLLMRLAATGHLTMPKGVRYFDYHPEIARLPAILSVFAMYVCKMLLPWPLSHRYRFPIMLAPGRLVDDGTLAFCNGWAAAAPKTCWALLPLAGALLLALCAAGAVWAMRRRSPWAAPLGWFLITLFPVSNIIPFGDLMADRFLYLPGAAFFLAAGLAVRSFLERKSFIGRRQDGGRAREAQGAFRSAWIAPMTPVLAAVLILGMLTAIRNRDWRDEASLWESALYAAPYNKEAMHSYATAMMQQAREDRLLSQARHGLPRFSAGQADAPLKEAERLEGRADRVFDAAAARWPEEVKILANYAELLATKKPPEPDKALEMYRRAQRAAAFNPAFSGNAQVMAMLANGAGKTLAMLKRPGEAEGSLAEAVKRDPRNADYIFDLARFFDATGDPKAARAGYAQAFRLNPNNPAIRQAYEKTR